MLLSSIFKIAVKRNKKNFLNQQIAAMVSVKCKHVILPKREVHCGQTYVDTWCFW